MNWETREIIETVLRDAHFVRPPKTCGAFYDSADTDDFNLVVHVGDKDATIELYEHAHDLGHLVTEIIDNGADVATVTRAALRLLAEMTRIIEIYIQADNLEPQGALG